MYIVKHGDIKRFREGDYKFKCEICGCEWFAFHSDKDLTISPPCLPFYVSMHCPDCGRYTVDEDGKKRM